MTHLTRVALVVCLASTAACGGGSDQPKTTPVAGKVVDAATAGSLSGSVKFEGAAPENTPIRLSKDCPPPTGAAPLNDAVLVSADGGLQNAFVYVKDGLDAAYTFDAPATPVELAQTGCIYTPRVLGVRVGQAIDVVNSDPTLHNVHALPMTNQEFNKSQPLQNSHMTHVFTAPEVMVKFICNVHQWMASYVGVVAHPYFAVSDASGRFDIKNLPPGTYTIEAWHEKFGRRTAHVTVGEKQAQTVAFTFAADKAGKVNDLTLPRAHTKLDDLVLLTKIRLNALVVATTAGGYYMAASARTVDPAELAATCLGTALVASAAAAINQVHERDIDRLMNRTKDRPVAGGRMSPGEGLTIAAALAAVGSVVLWLAASPAAAGLALLTLVTYVVIYTPLKRHTSLATVVGAVPGALPPLIGWVAAGGTLASAAPWSLFLLMFLWQLPHFLAIAWLYREDYARAGLPMLPVVDPHGFLTGRQAALWAATLVPVSELPFLLGLTNATYGVAALVLGLGLFWLAARFMIDRSHDNARRLFFGSITYLPILWIVMGVGRR